MSNVTLHIGGRRYVLACAEGEEEHITALGAVIDARVADQPNISRRSETQTLLYAALLLADELHETQPAAQDIEARSAGMSAITDSLEKLARRLEIIADELEDDKPTS